jgi:hypothetical protein
MHDRNGTPLQVGDVVAVEMRVVECYASADYCNVKLEYGFGAEHGPANVTGSISSINTRQTLLLKRPTEE